MANPILPVVDEAFYGYEDEFFEACPFTMGSGDGFGICCDEELPRPPYQEETATLTEHEAVIAARPGIGMRRCAGRSPWALAADQSRGRRQMSDEEVANCNVIISNFEAEMRAIEA